jgi:hypothetical protein
VDQARVFEQRLQAIEMVNCVAQRMPGGVAEFVRVRPQIVAAQGTTRRRLRTAGIRIDAGSPAVH